MHEPSCNIICSCNFVLSCIFDPSLVKIKTRAKLTPRAKVTPCKIVCLCNDVASCKSVFVQNDLLCKFIFEQFYLSEILCPRASIALCNFIFVQFCPLVQFLTLVHLWLHPLIIGISFAIKFNMSKVTHMFKENSLLLSPINGYS